MHASIHPHTHTHTHAPVDRDAPISTEPKRDSYAHTPPPPRHRTQRHSRVGDPVRGRRRRVRQARRRRLHDLHTTHKRTHTDTYENIRTHTDAECARPSPTLSPTDPAPRGLLTACKGLQGLKWHRTVCKVSCQLPGTPTPMVLHSSMPKET